MVYKPSLGKTTRPIRQAMEWGVWLIAAILGLGILTKEVQRILSLPFQLENFVYLALLLSICLLIVGWRWVSQKELDLLCEWLDPRHYAPPEETIVIFGISAALGILLLVANHPLLFGIAYSLYSGVNFGAWLHFRNQLKVALSGSRDRLKEEGVETAGTDVMYSAALDCLERYYILRPHVYRFIALLTLAGFGLVAACYGTFRSSVAARTTAYIAYIFAIFVFEEVVITRWRLRFYADLRSLSTALSERLRKVPTYGVENDGAPGGS
jgi:hypothetical protein